MKLATKWLRRCALILSLLPVLDAAAIPADRDAAALRSFTAGGLAIHTEIADASGAEFSVSATGDAAAIIANPGSAGDPERPFGGAMLWAVPYGTHHIAGAITDSRWRPVEQGEIPDSLVQAILADPWPLLQISTVKSLRGMRIASVAVHALQPDSQGTGLRLCESLRIRLRYEGQAAAPDGRLQSAVFRDLACTLTANLDDVVPVVRRVPEPYLIITRPAYEGPALQSLVNWKRARGHTVTVATTAQAGTTTQQIKTFIQNAYDHWPEPPVFVLLVGDVDGANSVPGWLEPGFYRPTNISDNPYTLLDGNDYLPDVLIGRLSVDTGTELLTAVNKCMLYESAAFEPAGAWRSSMLITGVRSSPGFYQAYNSAWPTLQWIGRQFRETADYETIYEVPYPGGNASQINARITSGVSYVAYRGFGAPSNWAFPPYDLSNINNLNNGGKLPVVTSIVCGGGAFDSAIDPCFGELWLRAGTPTIPKGAVGFIGPSELDTKTRWNNTIIAGIYEGILFENVTALGAAMLRGKLELLRQFPNNVDNMSADANRSVSFYFTCYNLLGDPGLGLCTGAAGSLDAAIPDTLALGIPSVTLQITHAEQPVADVWGTITRSDSVLSRGISDSAGFLSLALPQTSGGAVVVHLHKAGYQSRHDTVMLATRSESMGLLSANVIDDGRQGSTGNGDGLLNPGETAVLAAVLRNFGTAGYPGGSVSVIALNGGVSILNSPRPVAAIPAGGNSDTLYVQARIAGNAYDTQLFRLRWQVLPTGAEWETTHECFAPRLAVTGIATNGNARNPDPGLTQTVALTLANTGRATLAATTIILRPRDARLVLTDSTATYPTLAPQMQSAPIDAGFILNAGGFIPGDAAGAELVIGTAGDAPVMAYALPVGNLTDEDPTYPDSYGYRAYQSVDTAYAEAPAFGWLEIDPTRGGRGTVLALPDTDEGLDTTRTIDLPFAFTFYGQPYTRISVCSNGFVSFGETRESFFRNYALPAIASPDNMVCVFWDDLIVPPTGRICSFHDADAGRFIVEWSRLASQYGSGMEATFQLVLYDTACWPTRTGDGDLLMQFLVFNNSDSWDNQATIGIQDRDAGHWLQLTYAGAFAPGVAMMRAAQSVLLTTGRPTGEAYFNYAGMVIDDDQSGGSDGNGDGFAQNGETVEMQIRVRNTGTGSAPATGGVLRHADPYFTLLDSAVAFPPLAPGETAISNAVRLAIAPETPNRHTANFTLRLSGDTQPCVMTPSLLIASPLLYVSRLIMDDDAIPPSAGNGNGEWNAGEILELWTEVVNTGGNAAIGVTAWLRLVSDYAIALDTTAAISRVDADSTRLALEPFVIQIRPATPDRALVQLFVYCRDSIGSEWSNAFGYMVVSPRLSASGARVTDPLPGGNNNGRLSRGENGLLFPAIANSGSGSAAAVSARLFSLDPHIVIDSAAVEFGIINPEDRREAATPVAITVADAGAQPRIAPIAMEISTNGGFYGLDTTFVTIGDVRFADDFETDANYWSAWGAQLLWHRQSDESYSPTHAYYCGSRSLRQYLPNADENLRSPRFEFDGHGSLIIQTKFTFADAADVGRVQLQTGASTYHTLDELRGESGGWQERRYSLEGLPADNYTSVRFWFSSNYNGQAEGWFVDDVAILDEVAIGDDRPPHPAAREFALSPCAPNPFNGSTRIMFRVPVTGHVQLAVFDVTGRQVTRLIDGLREAGAYEAVWRPLTIGSGVYFLRLDCGDLRTVQKIVYLR